MHVDRNQFAAWLMEADVKSGLLPSESGFATSDYIEEADFYLGMTHDKWPCYILQKAQKHAEFHGTDCPPDPLHG